MIRKIVSSSSRLINSGGVAIQSWVAVYTGSPRIQKYFKNISWLVSEKVFTLFTALLVNIYVARYLQPENFGLLNYAISFVGIFTAFTALGLDQILVRELSQRPEQKNQILGTGFGLKIGGSFVLCLLMITIILVMNNGALLNTMILIIAGAEIFRAFEVINSYYQSRIESKYIVQVQMLATMAGNVIKVGLVLNGAPLVWFAWVILLNAMFNASGFLFNYRRKDGSPLKWKFNKVLSLKILRESWPLAIHGVALLTQARIDQVMLGRLINNAEVGQYSVALRFIEIFAFTPIILVNTFMPALSKAKTISEELYHNRLINFYRLMFLMFIVVAVPIFFLAEDTIVFLYGDEYKPAGVLLSLFSIRLFFTNMGVAKSVYTVNESLFKYSLLCTILGAITNIGINLILIPVYGSIGALIATVVSFSLSDFIVDLFYKKTRKNQYMIFRGICSFWKLKDAMKT